MKMQLCKKLPSFITLLIFTIAVLLFNASCSKDTKSLDSGKTTTGSSTIVYTDVKPDSVILKTNPTSFNLDLNNDGINDFVFNSTKGKCEAAMIAPPIPYIYLSVEPASGGNTIMTNSVIVPDIFNLAAAFDSTTAIAPASMWASISQYFLFGASTSGYIRCMVARGYWLNVSDKYVGLKFIKGNNTYYGWARLSSSIMHITAVPIKPFLQGKKNNAISN